MPDPSRRAAVLEALNGKQAPVPQPTPDAPSQGMIADFLRMLVRLNSAVSPPERQKQVAQYLGDDPHALPDAPDRPTALTKFQDQPYKSMHEYLPQLIELPPSVVGKDINTLQLPLKFGQNRDEMPANVPTVAIGSKSGGIGSRALTNYMGLGDATTSLGRDEQGKPYLSIFDSWDFENQGDPIEQLLKGLGRPYNVYDRIPIQLEGQGLIPRYVDPFSKGDIDLPPTKK